MEILELLRWGHTCDNPNQPKGATGCPNDKNLANLAKIPDCTTTPSDPSCIQNTNSPLPGLIPGGNIADTTTNAASPDTTNAASPDTSGSSDSGSGSSDSGSSDSGGDSGGGGGSDSGGRDHGSSDSGGGDHGGGSDSGGGGGDSGN